VRNENLLLQLKFCSLQSPMHYLSCEKSGLEHRAAGVSEKTPKGRWTTAACSRLGRSRISLDTILGESNPAKGVSECEEETLVRMTLSAAAGRRRRRRKRSCAC